MIINNVVPIASAEPIAENRRREAAENDMLMKN